MLSGAAGLGAPNEQEDEVVWQNYHWSIGTNVAAYFEVGGRGKKRKRKRLFLGEVVKYAKATENWKDDQLYHILWEDNDEEDYDWDDFKKGRELYNEMVLLRVLPFPKPIPSTSDGAPYCVIVEGKDPLPLHFLRRIENSRHDKSIEFNSNDVEDYQSFFYIVGKETYLESTKLSLVAGAPTTEPAEDTFKLTVEAPMSMKTEGPYRILVGGLCSIPQGFETDSWQFRKHLILQIEGLACTMRVLSKLHNS